MRGTLTVFRADGTSDSWALLAPPSLELLRETVGGEPHLVDLWRRSPVEGKLDDCRAYWLRGGPPNVVATELWHNSLPIGSKGELAGDVVVVWGDGDILAGCPIL